MTEEEKEILFQEFRERVYLGLPELVGSLMMRHLNNYKIREKFYKDHSELKGYGSLIQSVIDTMEGENPLKKYDELLEDALPEIKKRIEQMKNLDVTSPATKPKTLKIDNGAF